MHRTRYVGGVQSLFLDLSEHLSPCIYSVHQPESSLNRVLLGFYGKVSSQRHDWLNHWPLVIKLNLQPLLPL